MIGLKFSPISLLFVGSVVDSCHAESAESLNLMLFSDVLVSAQEVGKSFARVRAVDGVSFTVYRGQIFSLLGPNGAGKSTLVRMLIGMLPPDEGSFVWRNRQGNQIPLNRSSIGYLPEDRGLYKDQKVTPTLEYFAALRGLSKSESRQAAKFWIERLELTSYANSKLETLSKGNQQKVQIATAVLHRPEMVVLDEPFSGLDPINQELMMNFIREIKAEGATVLLSAHQLNLVERLADHVLLIANGREVLSGSVDEICQSSLGGKSLRIEFEHPIDSPLLVQLRSAKGVQKILTDQLNVVTLQIDAQENQTVWLNRMNELGTIRSFQSGATSLHEIYLKVASQPSAVAAAGQAS